MHPFSRLASLLAELRRRRVVRVAGVYAVVAWLLIQIVSTTFPLLLLPESLARASVVIVLLGFPIAVVLAWAYDLTPDGLARTQTPASGHLAGLPFRRHFRSPTVRVAGLALLILAGAWSFAAIRSGRVAVLPVPEVEAATRTVAVLPFSIRGSEELRYLREGLVDLLTADMATGGALQLVDAHSVLAAVESAPGVELDPSEAQRVAQRLGATLYVVGSLVEVEGRVRLTAGLYDRSRGSRPVVTRSMEGRVEEVMGLARQLAAALTAETAAADATVKEVRLVWSGPDVDPLGSVSWDGQLLSFVDWSTGDLAVRDLRTGSNRRLTDKGPWAQSAEFAEFSRVSPDGRRIAYAWFNRDSEYELRVANIDGSNPRTLHVSAWVAPWAWRSDGEAILVATEQAAAWVSVRDGRVDSLAVLRAPDVLSLSPDERWIAYHGPSESRRKETDIYLMAADGSRRGVVARHPSNEQVVAWTPNGRGLLFWSDRGGSPGVYLIGMRDGKGVGEPILVRSDMSPPLALGTVNDELYYAVGEGEFSAYQAVIDVPSGELLEGPTQIAHASAPNSHAPVWSPDGRQIAYLVDPRNQGAWAPGIVVVRSLETGTLREYPLYLRRSRIYQWSQQRNALLLRGRNPFIGAVDKLRWYWLDLDSNELEPVSPGKGETGAHLIVSPDEQYQYFIRWEREAFGHVVRYDAVARRETVLATVTNFARVALSPDGRQLAYSTMLSAGRTAEVYVLPSAGGSARLVHRLPADAYVGKLAWSSDGRNLLYTRIDDSDRLGELWRVRLEDGDAKAILAMNGLNRNFSVHPDGRRIAFSGGASRLEIWAMKLSPLESH